MVNIAHKKLTIFAAAKLNLYLNVCEKQVDGYHRIETVFQGIDLFDQLIFSLTEENTDKLDISIKLLPGKQSHLVPTDRKNLIYQAARFFMQKIGLSGFKLEVELLKKIPVSGGMAGGSSNAAATLYALNYLFGEPLKQNELLEVCRELGSDVPFCLLGGCMLGTGRGDLLTRLTLPNDLIFVVVFPPAEIELSAKDVYEMFDKLNKPEPSTISVEKFIETLLTKRTGVSKVLHNSLEEAVISLSYWVDKAKSAIDSRGYSALVSGSGPTIFTIAPNDVQAQQLVKSLKEEGYEASVHRAVDTAFQMIAH